MRSRGLAWTAVVAIVVLTARWLTYALAPSPLAERLAHSAGGPSLVAVALVSLALAAAVSAAALGLAALGVRERQRLRPERQLPRVRLRRVAARSASLAVVAALGFALLESYLHWREGLGFHGLSCLVGPVHRNALPILLALSLLTAALGEVVELLAAWARAVAGELLRPRVSLPALESSPAHFVAALPARDRRLRPRPRAPPLPA